MLFLSILDYNIFKCFYCSYANWYHFQFLLNGILIYLNFLCFRMPRIVNLMWDPTTIGKLQLHNQTVNLHYYLIDLLSLTITTYKWLKTWQTYCILLVYLARTINIFYVIDHKLKLYVEETHFSKFHNFYPNGLLHMFDSC